MSSCAESSATLAKIASSRPRDSDETRLDHCAAPLVAAATWLASVAAMRTSPLAERGDIRRVQHEPAVDHAGVDEWIERHRGDALHAEGVVAPPPRVGEHVVDDERLRAVGVALPRRTAVDRRPIPLGQAAPGLEVDSPVRIQGRPSPHVRRRVPAPPRRASPRTAHRARASCSSGLGEPVHGLSGRPDGAHPPRDRGSARPLRPTHAPDSAWAGSYKQASTMSAPRAVSSVGRAGTLNPKVEGSDPSRPM